MKSITRSIKAFLVVAAMAACGGQAYAAQLAQNFAAADGKVFQIASPISIEKADGAVNVKHQNGSTQAFADPTGAVWAKIVASPTFATHYVQVVGTNRYMNTTVTTEILCMSNQTWFGYPFGTLQPDVFADGCATHAVVRASSN
jgi:hypothetical protein